MNTTIFDSDLLIPDAWRLADNAGPVSVFNPSVLRFGGATVMAYQVVPPTGDRRVAICRLANDNTILPGSVRPLSDHLTYLTRGDDEDSYRARPADPRLVALGGRLYMHFNTGALPTPNRIYLVEIDPESLLPAGAAREVVKTGRRQNIEKNWMFFDHDGDVFVLYKMHPLTILRADLSDAERVVCTDAFIHHWDADGYSRTYGELRGGATPVLHEGRYYTVVHSSFDGRSGPGGRADERFTYVGAAIVFAGKPPFTPLLYSSKPILELAAVERALPKRVHLDTNVLEDVYPAGAVADSSGVTISYGVNAYHAALRRIRWQSLNDKLRPVILRTATRTLLPGWIRHSAATKTGLWNPVGTKAYGEPAIRAFWWLGGIRGVREHAPPPIPHDSRFVHGNFGDLSVPHLLGRLTGFAPRYTDRPGRLLTVGSLIQIAMDGDVIWGTGVNGARAELRNKPKHLHVYATRGPISCEVLRRGGFDVSRVTQMFDPVSLIGDIFADEIAAIRASIRDRPRNFILIPHFSDELTMRRLYPEFADRIRSADTPFFDMVRDILSSDLVVSSSLHGIIVAEALGIPAVWHRPLMGEDELKFTDYYLGTGRYKIIRVETLQEAFRVSPMPLPAFDAPAMLATFPSMAALEAHGILLHQKPLEPGRTISFAESLPDSVEMVSGFSHSEDHGIWTDGVRSIFEIFVGELAGDAVAELCMRAYQAADRPQHVVVSVGARRVGDFDIAGPRPRIFQFAIDKAMVAEGKLTVTLDIPTAVSPFSIGAGPDRRRLGVSLRTLLLRPAAGGATSANSLRFIGDPAPDLPPAAVLGGVAQSLG